MCANPTEWIPTLLNTSTDDCFNQTCNSNHNPSNYITFTLHSLNTTHPWWHREGRPSSREGGPCTGVVRLNRHPQGPGQRLCGLDICSQRCKNLFIYDGHSKNHWDKQPDWEALMWGKNEWGKTGWTISTESAGSRLLFVGSKLLLVGSRLLLAGSRLLLDPG